MRRRDHPRARVHEYLLHLIGRDLGRIEGDRKQLPAFGRRFEVELNGELCVLEICGDTRQRVDVSSTLLGHLAPD